MSIQGSLCDKFKKRLAWSFYWLFVGQWPDKDEDGNPFTPGSADAAKAKTDLAGGFYGCLWIVRGDMEYMCKAWGFPSPNGVKRCAHCLADTRALPWTDVRPDALWRATTWTTNQQWADAFPDRSILFKNVPGLSILNCMPDVMHAMHLGVYQYFFGSVLEYLAYHVMPNPPTENLKIVWKDILQSYRLHNVENKYSALKLTMFHKIGHMPALKGKAANIADLAVPLLDAASKHLSTEPLHHKQIILGLRQTVAIEKVLHENQANYVLQRSDGVKFKRAVDTLVAVGSALRMHFQGVSTADRPMLVFHFTIKSHALLHLSDVGLYINPRLGWCYSGESLMHRVRLLCQSSCRGLQSHALADKVLKKYCMAIAMTLSRKE